MADYIPGSDALFTTFCENFQAKLAAYQALLGLSVGQVADHATKLTEWQTRHATYLNAQNSLAAALNAKKVARKDLESYTRELTRFIQNNPAMTDELRGEFQVTVPDREPTQVPADYLASIEAPSIHIEWGVRGVATLHFGLVPTNEHLNAKPPFVAAANIQYCPGGIPTDDSAWQFLAQDTNSPYVHNVGDAAPQKYGYRAQWVDTQARYGPFGEAVDVTISD